jgi:DNA-binding XRE family transcriptional regulator
MGKNRLKEFRESMAWSISELARKADLTPQTVTKMEKGERTTRNSRIKASKALGKKPEEIFGDEE